MSPVYRIRTRGPVRLPAPDAQSGSALVWALFFVVVTTGMLISHSWEMQANRKEMDVRYRQRSLAGTIAQSGLTDVTAWFRRQATQPVTQFEPKLDPEADPPLFETIDPTKGLVREFEVRGNLWGRYEIRREDCIDVSFHYGEPSGSVWDVGTRGILYEVADPTKPFDQHPNRIVATRTMRTEVRGIDVTLPAWAGLVTPDPTKIIVGSDAYILGGAEYPAIVYSDAVGPVNVGALGLGTPNLQPIPSMDLSMLSVFGMREDKLRYLADMVLKSGTPPPKGEINDKIVFVDGNVDLWPGRGLKGRLALVVKGTFTAHPGNMSDFAGIVYVGGKTVIHGPFRLRGTLMSPNEVSIYGAPGSPAIVEFDPRSVSQMSDAMRQYRRSKDLRPAGTNGAFTDLSDWTAKE